MHVPIFLSAFGLLINTINIPFDRGANDVGSSRAPKTIGKDLDFLNIVYNYTVDTEQAHVSNILGDGYIYVWNTLNRDILPLVIGGDHTVAVSSISASNDYCSMNKQNMGVLWKSETRAISE